MRNNKVWLSWSAQNSDQSTNYISSFPSYPISFYLVLIYLFIILLVKLMSFRWASDFAAAANWLSGLGQTSVCTQSIGCVLYHRLYIIQSHESLHSQWRKMGALRFWFIWYLLPWKVNCIPGVQVSLLWLQGESKMTQTLIRFCFWLSVFLFPIHKMALQLSLGQCGHSIDVHVFWMLAVTCKWQLLFFTIKDSKCLEVMKCNVGCNGLHTVMYSLICGTV